MAKQILCFFIEKILFPKWIYTKMKNDLLKNTHTRPTGIVQLNFIHHPVFTLRKYSS
jgi:hypothetical protein